MRQSLDRRQPVRGDRATPEAEMHIVLYEFRAMLLTHTSTPPHLVKGSREAIERFIPLEEFPSLFGGYILWRPPADLTPDMPGKGLGVWSLRVGSRFRRLLRQRGARLQREPYPGPLQSLHIIHQGMGDRLTGP